MEKNGIKGYHDRVWDIAMSLNINPLIKPKRLNLRAGDVFKIIYGNFFKLF